MLARLRKAAENKDSGFTLIELLVVMIIIGILAAIAIPAFLNQRVKAAEAAAKSDATNIAKEIAGALVDGPTSAVTLTRVGTTNEYTLAVTVNGAVENSTVRVSAGNVPTVTTTGTAALPTEVYCVTVNPARPNASDWSAGDNGLFKGSACA